MEARPLGRRHAPRTYPTLNLQTLVDMLILGVFCIVMNEGVLVEDWGWCGARGDREAGARKCTLGEVLRCAAGLARAAWRRAHVRGRGKGGGGHAWLVARWRGSCGERRVATLGRGVTVEEEGAEGAVELESEEAPFSAGVEASDSASDGKT